MNWDRVARDQRARRHGSEYAYGELPPTGSVADVGRYFESRPPGSPRGSQLRATSPALPKGGSTRLGNRVNALRAILRAVNGPRWRSADRGRRLQIVNDMRGLLRELEAVAPEHPAVRQARNFLSAWSRSSRRYWHK